MQWEPIAIIVTITYPLATGGAILAIKHLSRDVAQTAIREALKEAESRFKLLLAESMTDHRDWMNGKYIRTNEQIKDNVRFEERLDDHDERIDALEVETQKLRIDMTNITASYARHIIHEPVPPKQQP